MGNDPISHKARIVTTVKVAEDNNGIILNHVIQSDKGTKGLSTFAFMQVMDIVAAGELAAQLNEAIWVLQKHHSDKLPVKIYEPKDSRSHA